MTDIETLRCYCLSLPYVTEDMAFGEECLLFRVFGKIFACYGFERNDYFVVKCNPDYAVELRDRFSEITPAWHWNKRYWNQISTSGNLSADFIFSLIRHSYSEVVGKLPRRVRQQYPELEEIRIANCYIESGVVNVDKK